MTTYTGVPGSVSSGTMRSEDLIPAFTTLLRSLAIQQRDEAALHLQLCDEANATLNHRNYVSEEDASLPTEQAAKLQEDRQIEDQQEVIDALFDALDAYAPEGYAFGAHEGDGADYGFWPVSLNDDWEPDEDEESDIATDSDLIPAHDGDAHGGRFVPAPGWEEREADVVQQGRSGVFGADHAMIDAFKAQWPGHGFPDDLNCVIATFAPLNELVEVEAFREDGSQLDTDGFDGPALLALVNDIQAKGYVANDDPDQVLAEVAEAKLGGEVHVHEAALLVMGSNMRVIPIQSRGAHEAQFSADEIARDAHAAERAFATAVTLIRELYESTELGLKPHTVLRTKVAAFLAEHG